MRPAAKTSISCDPIIAAKTSISCDPITKQVSSIRNRKLCDTHPNGNSGNVTGLFAQSPNHEDWRSSIREMYEGYSCTVYVHEMFLPDRGACVEQKHRKRDLSCHWDTHLQTAGYGKGPMIAWRTSVPLNIAFLAHGQGR
jgi:hypothetical protein